MDKTNHKKIFGEGGAWSEPKRQLGLFGRTRFIIVRPSRLPAGQALYHRLSVPFFKDRLPMVPVYMPGEVDG
ncbi:MAG: hypothetical protein ACMUIU_02660 [bacterium]